MSKQIQIAALAVAAIVLAGGGFVAGMTAGPTLGKTEAADTAATTAAAGGRAQQTGRAGAAGAAGAAFGGGQGQPVTGRVISVNDGSITVEVRQPGSDTARSVIALVGGSARVVRSSETDIKLSDLKAGDQVVVIGQADAATGTVSASAVLVGQNALQQLFGGAPGGPGGARPSGAPSQRPGASPSARP